MRADEIQAHLGVTLLTSVAGDQKRVMTPGKTIRAGADNIIVGRPVIEAGNPLDAARRIGREIATS